MNMFARFDENPAMNLQNIKETKRYGRTDARENSIPPTNKVCGGYKKFAGGIMIHHRIFRNGGGGGGEEFERPLNPLWFRH